MFDFIKNLTKPHFDVADYGQGILKFRCGKSLPMGRDVEGTANLPNGGKKIDLTIQVLQAVQGGYNARVVGPKAAVEALEMAFLPEAGKNKEQMFYKFNPEDATQHVRTYAVRSRQLPNYKGVTAELSTERATVILDGPIKKDLELQLDLDLDDVTMPPLKVEATVAWCKRRDEKSWVASLEFKELDEAQTHTLKEFLDDLKFRVPGSRPKIDEAALYDDDTT